MAKLKYKSRDNKWYGWIPDLPDNRDKIYSKKGKFNTKTLLSKIDLTSICPKVYNQGKMGSCSSNAIAAAHQFLQKKQDKTNIFEPSRLFLYYNSREIIGTVLYDSGAMIRDGIKSLNRQGVCSESEWVYDINKLVEKPNSECYTNALESQSVSYLSVEQDIISIKTCLSEGFPIVFGFSVYDGFESKKVAKNGKLQMPERKEILVGGHAVLMVGYDDYTKRVKVRNSWGNDWGDNGYFTMPYEYVMNKHMAADFWAIRSIK